MAELRELVGRAIPALARTVSPHRGACCAPQVAGPTPAGRQQHGRPDDAVKGPSATTTSGRRCCCRCWGFLDRIVEFAVVDTAWEADDAGVTPEMTSHPIALRAMAWRARSAAWLVRNRATIETALSHGAG